MGEELVLRLHMVNSTHLEVMISTFTTKNKNYNLQQLLSALSLSHYERWVWSKDEATHY